jgi:Cu2+-exporting ATPase
MDACGFPIPPDLAAVAARRAMQGKTTVYLAVAGVVQGATGLAPSVRPEALALITALRMRGLQLVMLTGDQFAPAQALAARLGIDHVFAEVLPAQKAALIMRLQRQGRRVLFVGDGINDGIALKQATVSVSLLGATTVATDMAQIVLMDQNLRQLDNLFELGRRFERDMQVQLGLAVATDLLTIGGVFTAGLGIAGAYGIAYAILLPATAYAFRVMWRQERLDPPTFGALPTHNAYPVPAADYGEEDRAYLFSD